jgi:hypothetical protein
MEDHSVVRRVPAALYRQKDFEYSCLLEAESIQETVRLGGLGQLKNPVTSSGIEHMPFCNHDSVHSQYDAVLHLLINSMLPLNLFFP